jgi:hypothetical protein
MALVVADRVKETSTTSGTGTLTLGGAVDGYQAFSVIGNGNTTYYALIDGTSWEVGLGTYTLSGTTLARTTILSSSNSNNAVNLSTNSKEVFVVYPAGKAVYKDASDNVTLGADLTLGDDLILDSDAAAIQFGDDQEVTLTHVHNSGLTLSAGANATVLNLTSTEAGSGVGPTINLTRDSASPAASDQLGYLNFVGEDAGSNQTNYAQIFAVITDPGSGSEDGKLSFYTITNGSSVLSLDLSGAALTVSGNIVIPNAGNIGSASDTDAIAISSGGVVSFSQVPTFPDDTIETADIQDNAVTLAKMAGLARGKIIYGDASGDPAALAVGSANTFLKTDGTDVSWASPSVALDDIATGDAAATLATSAGNITIDAQGSDTDIILKGTDGGADTVFLTVDGSDGGTASFSHDVKLANDGAVLGFGSGNDVTLTHVHDSGLTLSAGANATALNLTSTDDGGSVAPTINLIRDSASPAASDQLGYLNFVGEDAGSNQTNYAQIIAVITDPGSGSEDGKLSFYTVTSGSNTLSLDLSGTALTVSNDIELASDAAELKFGADSDVTLTHVHNTGLLLNSTMALQFNDASQYINAPSATVLDITATDEVEINATLADVNANLDVSGTYTGGGTMTTGGNIVIPDAGNIGSASDTDAMAISSGGVVAFSAVPTFPNDTIETADIQDNAVTLAKMAGIARGKLIIGDSSGNPSVIGPGNNAQVLTSDGTDIAFADVTASSLAADNITTGDAAVSIATTSGNITIDAQANDTDVIIKVDDAGSSVTAVTFDGSDEGNAIFVNDIQLKSDGALLEFGADLDTTLTHTDGTGLTLNSTNKLTFGDAASFVQQSGDGVLRIDGEATIDLNASTAVTVSNDLQLDSDAAVLGFGVNNDVTLTHVHDTGLLLNGTMQLQFNDASQNITAPSATVLDINATDEVEINATLADINANLDVSGTYTGGGTMTTGGNIVIPDDGTIGSASDTDSIQIRSDGNVAIGASASDTIGFYVYNNTTGDKVGQFTQAHASNSNNALQVNQSGTGAGLYAQVELGTNSAVFGFHNSSSSVGIGTRGYSKSGYGVYGQTGDSSYAGVIGYSEDASAYAILGYANTYGVYATTVTCVGAMSKGSGTFRIPHGLREDYDLCHSFIEGPQCDLIYRGRVDLVNGRATISMNTKYGMTAGTFEWLTKDVQTFTSNETGWDAVKSSFSGDTITIECQSTSSTDTISWMVVAERDDPNIKSSSITDSNGDLLIERPSDPLPPPPSPL